VLNEYNADEQQLLQRVAPVLPEEVVDEHDPAQQEQEGEMDINVNAQHAP
jgi:hypothetical protein